jgi:hypothetical protein
MRDFLDVIALKSIFANDILTWLQKLNIALSWKIILVKVTDSAWKFILVLNDATLSYLADTPRCCRR